jgi:hypothetical protein
LEGCMAWCPCWPCCSSLTSSCSCC